MLLHCWFLLQVMVVGVWGVLNPALSVCCTDTVPPSRTLSLSMLFVRKAQVGGWGGGLVVESSCS